MNFNVTTVFTPLQRQELRNQYHHQKRLDAQMSKVAQQASRSYKSTVEVKRVCRRQLAAATAAVEKEEQDRKAAEEAAHQQPPPDPAPPLPPSDTCASPPPPSPPPS